ncbi:MAG: hypothetical protein HYW51_00815 [Candidatus Doudnabacteria bacterium]|nr:hypothetical protein [Candidatus Doudnabacteria bacterium]
MIIKNKEQAIIAGYLLNPGQRHYQVGGPASWKHLFSKLRVKKLLKIFEEIELPLMPVLAKMEKRGIKLDLKQLRQLSKKLTSRIDKLTKQIYRQAGKKFNVASPIQLRDVLFEHLKIPTENLRKTGKTKALSTAATELEKLRELHPIIDLILEYRELTKLKSTYVDALPELVGADGRLHTKYSQTVAATGRLSSSDPNLQNIPIRTELGNQVRKAFVAEKGFVLASLDYSQIELRIAATLSGDKEMIKIFSAGGGSAFGGKDGDFHASTASRIFDTPESKVTPRQRRDAKTINFSVLYGVSAFGLSSRSEMSQAEARDYINKYYEVFKDLKKYIDTTIKQAHEDEFVTNPLGRIRNFAEINSPVYPIRAAAERAAFNMPLQSLAADIMKMAMIRIDEFLQNSSISDLISPSGGDAAKGDREGKTAVNDECRLLLSVHDELVFEIKKGKEKQYLPKIKKIMETVYQLSVPVTVDVKVGKNWMEMKELE